MLVEGHTSTSMTLLTSHLPSPPHSRQNSGLGDKGKTRRLEEWSVPLPPSPQSCSSQDYDSPSPPSIPSSPLLACDGQPGETHLPKIDEYIVLSSNSFRQGGCSLKRYRSTSSELVLATAPRVGDASLNGLESRKMARSDVLLDGFALDELDYSQGDLFSIESDPLGAPKVVAPEFDWQNMINHAFQYSLNDIELGDRGLTYIPPEIGDLKHLIAKVDDALGAEIDVQSTSDQNFSSSDLPERRNGLRTRTHSQELYTALNEASLRIFLQKNELTALSLPQELFDLDRLVLLTLRNNKLEEVPTAIGHLTSLQELNLAFNRIRYLPAEILQCKQLTNILVEPNPLIQKPANLPITASGRKLDSLKVHSKVPSLAEYAQRKILCMAGRPKAISALRCDEIRLSERSSIGLKLSNHDLPEHLFTGLARAIHEQKYCCNPACRAGNSDLLQRSSGAQGRYAQPCVERLEWTTIGKDIGAKEIPILWRGCSAHCLDFLEQEPASQTCAQV